MRRIAWLPGVVLLALVSCAKSSKALRTFQLPVAPAPAVIQPVAQLGSPPEISPAEQSPPDAVQTLAPVFEPPPDLNRRAKRRTPSQAQTGEAQQAPAAGETAPVRLGTMFTPDQQREFARQIGENMNRARHNLSSVSRRRMNTNQRETADQIETFLKQAQAAMATDLEAARSLSERAELLSRGLLRSLQ